MECSRCGGNHAAGECRRYLIFQGYAFAPPYLCMCCGKAIAPKRWIESHTCPDCDWGKCQDERPGHAIPLWRHTPDGTEAFELYVEYVEAIPRNRL